VRAALSECGEEAKAKSMQVCISIVAIAGNNF
jgi:hypothetical protein